MIIVCGKKLTEKNYGDKKQTSKSTLKDTFENLLKKEQLKEDENQQEPEGQGFDENWDFEKNRQERKERARKCLDKLKNQGLQSGVKISFDGVGESKSVVDWKLLLRREVEKTEDIWSQCRSIEEKVYAYRLEENEIEDEAMTEVMIDASGSVKIDMIKAFLRQLKPILRESKLKVGCFNGKFWGFTEIKSVRDIDNFSIPKEARGHSAWTEDWDIAVRSFSKKKEVNIIVFTDGYSCPGTMPKEDLKGANVLWLVYGNGYFKPCCGKVIFIQEKDFQQMNAKYEDLELGM